MIPLPPSDKYPHTPDGRYFVVHGRLWRLSNPHLDAVTRDALVRELMAVRSTRGDAEALARARAQVDSAKHALGERGPVWWCERLPRSSGKPMCGQRLSRAKTCPLSYTSRIGGCWPCTAGP